MDWPLHIHVQNSAVLASCLTENLITEVSSSAVVVSSSSSSSSSK